MSDGSGFAVNQAVEGLSFLSVLEDCLDCGIVGIDTRGRIAFVTPAAGRILHLEAEQLVGHPFEVLPPAFAAFLRQVWDASAPLVEQSFEVETGKDNALRVRVTVVRLEKGIKNPALIAILNDLSPARRLECDISRLDRLANIGALSASMAHEIKNALVAVKTFTELTLERQPNIELGIVAQRELKRAESIVSQMLKFAGPSQPKLVPVRLHEILDHSLRLVQHQISTRAIRMEREYQAVTDWVDGDDYQLEQAFVNLILNAVEAMQPGGKLTLRTCLLPPTDPPAALRAGGGDPRLCVTVSDTGAGITAEHLGRIFDTFFTTKREGTGLGLAITRRILEQHRATITVESEVSRGSSFHVCFTPLPRA